MDNLPNELLQNILIQSTYQQLWNLRRVSVRFKLNCEKAFSIKLLDLNSTVPILHLHLLIINSRGSPWFHLIESDQGQVNHSIEDQVKIPLYIKSVDFSNQVLQLSHTPKSIAETTNLISLERRSHLSRFEWCLKGLFRPSTPNPNKPRKSDSAFTLVSVDTDIIGEKEGNEDNDSDEEQQF